jgi:hypothetical protein
MPEYRVTGPFPFRGNDLGATFKAETDERIERAVKRGSISETSDKPAAAPSGDATGATPPQTTPPPAPVSGSAVGSKVQGGLTK